MAVDKYCLLTEDGTSGTYWANLPTSDPGDGGNYRDRYLDDGIYYVYSRYYDFLDEYINNKKDFRVRLTLEIQGKWTDSYMNYTAGTTIKGFRSCTITTKINGVRDPDSYHYGAIGGGWVHTYPYAATAFYSSSIDFTVDGIELNSTKATTGFFSSAPGAVFQNCIGRTDGRGIFVYAPSNVNNNLIYGCTGTAFNMQGYQSGYTLNNNLAIGNDVGFDGEYVYLAFVANNIAIDNTTANWQNLPNDGIFENNAGESGDIVWDTETSAVTITSADFENYANPPTSLSDLSPAGDSAAHTSSSSLTDAGAATEEETDITGNPRVGYKNGLDTSIDIGPYEFDWGYGLAPQTVSLLITGIVAGSELAIYKTIDGTEIVAPTTITGTSYTNSNYIYMVDTNVTVRIRNASGTTKYLPYKAQGVITENGLNMIVSQTEDTIA